MIDFTHKKTKDMLYYLKKLCLSLTNTENNEQLRETELPWNPEGKLPCISQNYIRRRRG